jgi:hypothetical protein
MLDAIGAFFLLMAMGTDQPTSILLWASGAGAVASLAIFVVNWRAVNRACGMYGVAAQQAQVIKNSHQNERTSRIAGIAGAAGGSLAAVLVAIAAALFGATQGAIVCAATAFVGGLVLALGVLGHLTLLRVRWFYGREYDVADNHDV